MLTIKLNDLIQSKSTFNLNSFGHFANEIWIKSEFIIPSPLASLVNIITRVTGFCPSDGFLCESAVVVFEHACVLEPSPCVGACVHVHRYKCSHFVLLSADCPSSQTLLAKINRMSGMCCERPSRTTHTHTKHIHMNYAPNWAPHPSWHDSTQLWGIHAYSSNNLPPLFLCSLWLSGPGQSSAHAANL